MAVAAIAANPRLNDRILRIPIVNDTLVDAVGDLQLTVDVNAVVRQSAIGDAAKIIGRSQSLKLVVIAHTVVGSPDVTIDRIQTALSDTAAEFGHLTPALNMQFTTASRQDKTFEGLIGYAPFVRLQATAAQLTGSHSFKMLIYMEVVLPADYRE